MIEFLSAVAEHSFLQKALLAGVLAGIACGVIGPFIVARRISYIGGGIAHSVLGGMGAAYFFSNVFKWEWLHPLYGAVAAALLSAIVIGLVSLKARQREDTVISAIWAIGMAVGIIFIMKTPGYNENLLSYLFGNILMVSSHDLWQIAALDLLIIAIVILFYNKFLAICFDEQFARARGINVEFYYLLLLCLTALTVVVLITVVGIVMVIALLTLPVAIASCFTRTLWQTMILSTITTIVLTLFGLAISYDLDLPSGATIILLAGFMFLLTIVGKQLFSRLLLQKGDK